MDLYLISVLVFAVVMAVIIYRDRKNWTFGLMFMRKFQKPSAVFDRLAKYRRFWKIVSSLAIIVAMYLMFEGVSSFATASWMIATGEYSGPSGGIVIPYPSADVEVGYGYVKFPFWFWLFILPLVIIPHEMFHGIIARVEKIRIKSSGIATILLFPIAAFVEPDDKDFERSKTWSKIRVAAVGSFANIVMLVIVMGIASLSWPFLVNSEGILIDSVEENSPAYAAGFEEGMVITEVNGTGVSTSFNNYYLGLDAEPGDVVSFVADGNEYHITLAENPDGGDQGWLGITYGPDASGFSSSIFQFMNWLMLFELWIAIFNMLPLYPLDGGLILKAAVETRTKNWKPAVYGISMLMGALVLFLLFGGLVMETLSGLL